MKLALLILIFGISERAHDHALKPTDQSASFGRKVAQLNGEFEDRAGGRVSHLMWVRVPPFFYFDLCGVDGQHAVGLTTHWNGSTPFLGRGAKPVQFRPQVNSTSRRLEAVTRFRRSHERAEPKMPDGPVHLARENQVENKVGSNPARDTNFLDRLAQIESGSKSDAVGDKGQSRGAYQLSEAAWLDVNSYRRSKGLPTFPWSHAHKPIARTYAAQYLEILSKQFQSANQGRIPTERQALAMYQSGYSGAMRRGILSGGKAK